MNIVSPIQVIGFMSSAKRLADGFLGRTAPSVVATPPELPPKRSYARLSDFRVGQKVWFRHKDDYVVITIGRINTVTLSGVTAHGQNWRVSPHVVTMLQGV